MAEPDPRRALAIVVEHGTEIFRRLAPIADAMTAAGLTDPDGRRGARGPSTPQRREGMTRIVEALAAKAPLACRVQRAVDVLDVVQSMSTYNAFVRGCGWSTEDYKALGVRDPALPPAPLRDLARSTRPRHPVSFHDDSGADDIEQPKETR